MQMQQKANTKAAVAMPATPPTDIIPTENYKREKVSRGRDDNESSMQQRKQLQS